MDFQDTSLQSLAINLPPPHVAGYVISTTNSHNIVNSQLNTTHNHFYQCHGVGHDTLGSVSSSDPAILEESILESTPSEEESVSSKIITQRVVFQDSPEGSKKSKLGPHHSKLSRIKLEDDDSYEFASSGYSTREASGPSTFMHSLETVRTATTSMNNGYTKSHNLVPVKREDIKLPSDVVAPIRTYMQGDFFFSNHSIPLWSPSPPGINQPRKSRELNVCVGDVGFFNDEGGFEVIFNVFISGEENSDYGFETPPDFIPYQARHASQISRMTQVAKHNYVHCVGDFDPVPSTQRDAFEKDCAYAYTMPAGKRLMVGNLLVLPEGAWKDKMHTQTLKKMQRYFDFCVPIWYNHYNNSEYGGRTIPRGSLKIVNCVYKSKNWALATCTRERSKGRDALHAKLHRESDDADMYQWGLNKGFHGKTGPSMEEMEGKKATLDNQCVALEVNSIKITTDIQAATTKFRTFMNTMSRISLSSSKRISTNT